MRRLMTIMLCIVTLCGLEAKPKKLKPGETYTILDQTFATYEAPGEALLRGDAAELGRLLDAGVSPHTKQGDGISLLGIAIQTGNVEMVRLILEHPKFTDIDELFTVVINLGPRLTMRSSAIIEAIKTENPEVIALILNKNPDLEGLYEEILHTPQRKELQLIYTPLLLARNTLDVYAGTTKKTRGGYLMADLAEQMQRIADATKNINLIIPHNQNASGPDNKPYPNQLPNVVQKQSLMMCMLPSATSDHAPNQYVNKMIMSLIDRGMDVKYSYVLDMTAYNKAVAKQYGAMLDPLVAQQMAAMNKTAVAKQTKYASHIQNNAELLAYVLDHGGTVEHEGDKGAAFFCSLTDLPTIELMVERGTDINVLSPLNGFPVLFTVIGVADAKLLEGVMELGADVELLNQNGWSVEKSLQGLRPRDKKKQMEVLEKY